MSRDNINTALIPAGTYQLGDPCYASAFSRDFSRDDNVWLNFIESASYFHDQATSTFTHHTTGKRLTGWAWHTAYGDGTYTDVQGREYSVDSGLLGLIPLLEGEEAADLTHKIEMPQGGNAYFDPEDSKLYIHIYGEASIVISTGDEDDDEYDYEDEDEYDDPILV